MADMYSERDLAVMSGMFARTNLGHGLPRPIDVSNLLVIAEKVDIDLLPELSIDLLCRGLYEGSDVVQQAFHEEADKWFSNLKQMNQLLLRHVWPEHCRIFNEAKFELHLRMKRRMH